MSYPVILASESPRRREILGKFLANFEVAPASLDETEFYDADPWIFAQRLAKEKALKVFELRPECLVIAGDTIVCLEDSSGYRQFGKPVDLKDAERMLGVLSGKEHVVITGVALRWPKGMSAFTETSRVTFRDLTPQDIDAYLAAGESMDKAGAYALQSLAREFVTRIEGSTDNIIGLPSEPLFKALKELGY